MSEMNGELQQLERGWSEAHFDEEARSYLLTEARQRVQEQIKFMDSQDVRIATVFTVSVLIVSATGIIGEVAFAVETVAIFTLIAFAASVIEWGLCWWAYRSNTIDTGVNVVRMAFDYAGSSRQQLQDAALETLVDGFSDNQRVINERSRWLRSSILMLGVQLALLVATIVAGAF
ncbi:MAG: hypothetical protein F4038_12795 [Chloroflexi bacterium]|nr:hypothetical protein [Chloroflexota bacterium]MYJ93910.1 hypothetical protein [Chloroflexota bacterium]